MILRHTLLFQFVLWQCLFNPAVSVDDEEYVRVMVGFYNRDDEVEYVREQRRLSSTANGKPTTKINYEFQTTEAVAMEATWAELEEMKKDSRVLYIEEDLLVTEVSSALRGKSFYVDDNAVTRTTTLQDQVEDMRKLREIRSYAIEMMQADIDIDPDLTWDQECGVYTCVVDSGVYIDNEDIPYSRGDGYVDGKTFGPAEGQDWYYPRNSNHGTGVAGIMVARGGNNRGVVGVIPEGPKKSNICLRVAKVAADGQNTAPISALLEAAEWCAAEAGDKPLVVNVSYAANFGTVSGMKIYERLYQQGVLFVAAAGNGGNSELSYPAAYNSVIGVASVNAESRRSIFSQYNSRVELSAPGEQIEVLKAETDDTEMADGTSISSPFVAGIAARIWSAHPRCSNKEIRQALLDSARPLGDGVPNRFYGYGLIQARDAHDVLVKSGCNKAPAAPPTVNNDDEDPTSPPTKTPISPPTPPPTSNQDQSLSCIQTGTGGELSVPNNRFFRKGEVHCLRRGDGQQAYFGLTPSNQLGLFVNGQALWTVRAAASGWMFQSDGNMVLKNSSNQVIWTTRTGGKWNSILRMSFERVWIESDAGTTVWSKPTNVGFPTSPPIPPPIPPPTPPPTRNEDQSLNCIQSVTGNELSIPSNMFMRKGEVHCLRRGNGEQAYFGLTPSNQFGLFVNDQAMWTVPNEISIAASGWIFQSDGNLLLRNSNNRNIWRTNTGGNLNSIMRMSFERVWIESNTGSTLWSWSI